MCTLLHPIFFPGNSRGFGYTSFKAKFRQTSVSTAQRKSPQKTDCATHVAWQLRKCASCKDLLVTYARSVEQKKFSILSHPKNRMREIGHRMFCPR